MRVLSRAAVLVALSAVAVAPRAGAQSVVVGPLPSSMSAIPGASITVPVVADLTSSGGASLGSIAARLTWNPGTLAYVSSSMGTLGSPTVNVDSASGILRFALANAGGATGMPVLINVTFNVTGAPADTTVLGLTVSEITAAGTFANLTPITTGAHFCTSTGLWGDLDGDATFTGADALVILTYAVGLPLPDGKSVVNGDVDGNGTVDTRDALIVLSAAVGIPVSQFRIGHINPGLCSLRSADSVQIQPRTATVAPGDSLPVTAVVKDSTGVLVQGVGLVWQSKDPTIVRPGAAGSLVAVAPGSTYALVFVQPGVKDSVPVVVTATRHVWYVNPAVAAANLGVEFGSQVYPFSSIDTALARAAANDTVHVGVADYGPVHIEKPLVMLGDLATGGFPRLTNAAGSALHIDSVAGAVTVRGFRLLNSLKGATAKLVQTLTLASISVEGSRDLGIYVHGVDSLQLAHASVVGAVGTGIAVDSFRTAVLDTVRADVIARAPGGSVPSLGLHIATGNTVSADSLTLSTAGALVDSVQSASLRRIRVTGSQGPALLVNGSAVTVVAGDFSGARPVNGGALASWDSMSYAVALRASGPIQFDSSKVHDNATFGVSLGGGNPTASLRADTVARNSSASSDDASSHIYGFGWLRMGQTLFLNNGPGYVDIGGGGTDSVTADSTVFDGTAAYVNDVYALRMHGGAIRHASAPTFGVESAAAVELDSVEVSGIGLLSEFEPAIYVYDADSVDVNGINAHDNASGALGVWYSTALRVTGGSMLNNGFGRYGETTRFTVGAYYVGDMRVYGLTLRDSSDVGLLITPSGTSRTVVDSSMLQGSGTLVQDRYYSAPSADTLLVSRSWLTGFGGRSVYGIDAQYLVKLVVTQNLIDGINDGFGDGNAVQTYGVDTTLASGNTISNWGNAGLSLANGVLTADTNAFAGCVPGGAAIYAWQPGTTSVVGNSLTGCGSLVWLYGPSGSSGPAVQVLGNTVTLDTTTAQPGIYLLYRLGYVQVVGNTVVGGGGQGISIGANYNVDAARVDSNTVQQTHGNGIQVSNVSGGLSLTHNLASDNRGYGLFMYSPFTAEYNTVVRNDSGGVADSSYGTGYFRNGNIVGNVHYGAATFISTLWADSNWWGDARGPSCVELCDPASAGDSISGSLVSFAPRDSIGPVAGAPAIPVPPSAPVARPLAARVGTVPRPPKTPANVRRQGTAPQAAAQAAPRPVVPRPVRHTGRPTGHHRPVWKTGVPR